MAVPAVYADQLGAGSVDANNRPVFIATEHTRFMPIENREMTDQEKARYRQFQLWRTTNSLERRDSVYQSITKCDQTQSNLLHSQMGTPFPVIDGNPHMADCFYGIRWYEHLFSFTVGIAYNYYVRSIPVLRHTHLRQQTRGMMFGLNWVCTEWLFMYRSSFRLRGEAPNDYECRYYGVMEDKKRLQEKAELWAKYAAYKEEWMRRWDYHVYGIRPGERKSFWSACFFSPTPIRYNTCTDYPMRKNPYFLSAAPLKDMFLESPFLYHLPQREKNFPLAQARPESVQLYHGPDKSSAESTRQ